MTLEYKIIEMYHHWHMPMPTIAAMLDVEIRRAHLSYSTQFRSTVAPTPLRFVAVVLATEHQQIKDLTTAEKFKTKVAV